MLLNDYMHTGVLAKLGHKAPRLATVLAGRFAYFPISFHFISEHKTKKSPIDFCISKLLLPLLF